MISPNSRIACDTVFTRMDNSSLSSCFAVLSHRPWIRYDTISIELHKHATAPPAIASDGSSRGWQRASTTVRRVAAALDHAVLSNCPGGGAAMVPGHYHAKMNMY